MRLLLKQWIIFALKQFFCDIRIKGEPIVAQGPLLVVSNHPNSLLDPLVITYVFPQSLWYLAKSTAFKGTFSGRILRSLRMLPVYRRQDVGEETWRNEETFHAVTSELSKSGSILIFPEGISTGERRLSKVKTGAARIVLQAEALNDFNLGLMIQPVGLTYSNTGGFKSSVAIRLGKPMLISDWRYRYEADPVVAVKELTETIEREIRKVTVEVISSSDAGLVEQIAWLYRSAGLVVDEHEGYQLIARNVERQNAVSDDLRQRMFKEITALRAIASSLGLEREQLVLQKISGFKVGFLAPVILLGVLINYLPYRGLTLLARIDSDKILTGVSRAFTLSLFVFPIWYLLPVIVLICLGTPVWIGALAWCVLLWIGHLTNKYWQSLKILFNKLFSITGLSTYSKLIAQRDSLLTELDLLRLE